MLLIRIHHEFKWSKHIIIHTRVYTKQLRLKLLKIGASFLIKIWSDRSPQLVLMAEPSPCTYKLRSAHVHELWISISSALTEYVLYGILEHDGRIVIYMYTYII